jgi:S1-C subfamily serine protease
VTPQIAESLGLEKLRVWLFGRRSRSAADEAGIRRGDVILEVDRKPIRSIDEYKKAVAGFAKAKGSSIGAPWQSTLF